MKICDIKLLSLYIIYRKPIKLIIIIHLYCILLVYYKYSIEIQTLIFSNFKMIFIPFDILYIPYINIFSFEIYNIIFYILYYIHMYVCMYIVGKGKGKAIYDGIYMTR